MISAIILTWNSEKYIGKCVESLVESIKFSGEDFEIFIFDNGSQDKTVEIVKKLCGRFSSIELTELKENRGTTYSRNLGIKRARGEYVLILDSDVEIEKETVKELLKALKEDLKTGIIAPKLLYNSGQLQFSFKRFPTLKTKIFKVLGSSFAFFQRLAEKDELYGEKSDIFYPDYCISACWLVRKEVFEKVGLFDENIFYSPEDVDYCLRVWLSGYRVVYYPFVKALHHTQRVSYRDKKIALRFIGGLFYYFKKHRYLFCRNGVYKKISKAIRKDYPISI